MAVHLWWCIAGGEPLATASVDHTREDALGFLHIANTVLAPVYGPLAEQIVAEYNLATKQGIGIDVGSGPGHLIIEFCKRTRHMEWINADIDPHFFPFFLKAAEEAGVRHRVRAEQADAQAMPFADSYADIVVSRGSFQFWQNRRQAFAEIYRVLKPGGIALIGRGFSPNLPVETARKIRAKQRQSGKLPRYDVAGTAAELRGIMQALGIEDHRIRIPKPAGSDGVNYGIWLEFRKPFSPTGGQEERVYAAEPTQVIARRWRDVMAAPLSESSGLESSITTVGKTDISRQGAKTIIEALKYVPGAWVETRGRKVKQFFSVRGQKYPYPEYAVAGAWQREFHELPYFFSAADVERIEVIRSSAALLKGLSGLTGIVDIIPREYEEPETSGEIEFGTFSAYRLYLSHGAARERVSYALSMQRRHNDGPAGRHAAEGMTNLRGSVSWYPSNRLSVQTHVFHLDGERELAKAEPPAASRFQNTLEKFDPFRATLVSVKAHYRHSAKNSAELLWSFADRDHAFINEGSVPHESAEEDDREWGVSSIFSRAISKRNVLRLGGFYNHWVAPNGKRFYIGRRADVETFSAVVVDEHRWGAGIVDAGLRWVKTRINEYGGFSISGSPKGFTEVRPIMDAWEPAIWNGNVGIAYYLSDHLSLHFNLASGHVRPRRGSLDVNLAEPEDERRIKVDLGIRPSHGRIGQFSIAGFFVHQDDAIILSGQTETLDGRIMELYLNRDQIQLGVELEARSPPLVHDTGLFFNLTAMRVQAEYDGKMKRNRELPQMIMSGGLHASRSKFDLNLFWKHVSSYESTRFVASAKGESPIPQPLGDFTTLNGTGGWSFGEKYQTRIYLEVENLTDGEFSTIVGYPDYGRRFTLGVHQSFK